MKICDVVLDSIWFDPRVRKQLTEYVAQGIEVSAVGIKCNRYDPEKLDLIPCKYNIVEFDGNAGKDIFSRLKRSKQRTQAIRDAIIAEKPDVIHANDLSALIPAYAAARKLKCKLIYDSHEINVENYFSGKRSALAILMKQIEQYIVRRVDLMVCVSNAAAEFFAREYKIKKPMVVTNCSLQKEAVDLTQVEKCPDFEIINHGMFYEGRGYDIMAEALPLLKDYPQLYLAIRGFGKLEKQIRKIVETQGNREQFRIYPPVLVQELIPMAAKSHVGVAITVPICLNFKLSVSNKLFEYASAGLPVIMSDIPEHRYLNEKYNFGIIIPQDTPEAFAEAAIRLYQDKELYNTLAQNAQRLSAEVNWETEFGRLIEAEKALLKV